MDAILKMNNVDGLEVETPTCDSPTVESPTVALQEKGRAQRTGRPRHLTLKYLVSLSVMAIVFLSVIWWGKFPAG